MSIGDTDFGVQVGIGFVGRVVTLLVAFLGSIFLARILGPVGYGSFYLLMAAVEFLDNPVTGWATACRKRLTEEGFPAGEAVGSTLVGIVVAAAVVAAGAWLAAPVVNAYAGGVPDAWLLLSVLFVGMASYITTLEVLKATAYFGASNWMMAARDIVRVLAQAALVLAGYGVAGMVGGIVFANFVVVPVVIYLLVVTPELPSKDSLREVWSFAKSSIPNGVVGTAQNRMDVILLGTLVGPGVVGNYEVALRMTMPAMFVAGVASGGLMGRVSNRRSRNEDVAVDIQNNVAYASLVAIPLFFGALTIGGPVVVTIYSSQYADAGAFIAGLALFHLIRSQKTILVSTIDGLDRPDLNLRVSIVVFALNLGLGIGLLLLVGPIGVVVATVISEAIAYAARAYLVRSLIPPVSFLPRPFVHQLASGALMALVVCSVRQLISLGSWLNVALLVGLGGVVYVTTLLLVSEPLRGTIQAVAVDAGLF